MTYCVAMNLRDGLVFASDSRTSAGTDYVTSYSKMHLFTPANDRIFVLLSAGNLATTQEVINRLQRDLDHHETNESLLSAQYMFEAADYVGRVSLEVQQSHQAALQQAGVNGETSLILGGQIMGQPHSLKLIYPQGNYIESSVATPFLQIGETKYGKPVLDRALDYNTPLDRAAKLALVSLNSTSKSNISVGAPFELSTYHSGSFKLDKRMKFEETGEYLLALETMWTSGLSQLCETIPDFDQFSSQGVLPLESVPSPSSQPAIEIAEESQNQTQINPAMIPNNQMKVS